MTRRQPLSPEQIKAAIASGEFHKLADGESLYCVVRNGRAFWVGQFWRDGKVASCGLGAFADTSPPAARKAWQAMKTKLRDGIAPAARARTVALPSNGTVVQAATAHTARPFADACAAYLEARRGDWGDSRHDTKLQIVRDYLGPIAKVRVDRLTVDDVVGVLRPKWTGTGSNTGTHLRSIIENVLGAEGVPVNVAAWATLKHRLTTSPAAKAPHASMAWKDAPTLWSKLAGNESSSARALKLLVLCGTRAGETLAADWSEFDLAEKVWTIPAAHRKLAKAQKANPANFHKVPLSDAAIAALGTPGQGLVAKPSRGAQLGNDVLADTFKPCGFIDPVQKRPAVVHGLRSTFGDWGRDNGWSDAVVDCALAHKQVGVRKSYFRSSLFEERRKLHDAWASYVTA